MPVRYCRAVEIVVFRGDNERVCRLGGVLLLAEQHKIVIIIVIGLPTYEYTAFQYCAGVSMGYNHLPDRSSFVKIQRRTGQLYRLKSR